MRVFISSVRRGLEQERDALPGLVQALGHIPVRFEDYTAQSVPSRQACLDGVASADVYLMLLGPNYGHRFPETGQSPTHDEWVAARAAGLRRLVFRKTGVDFEHEQEEFAREVGDYGTGVFYGEFTGYPDLAPKVVQALRELESTPATLTFAPLAEPVPVLWRDGFPENAHARQSTGPAAVEVHVVPVNVRGRTAREMAQLAEGFAGRVRRTGHVPDEVALVPHTGADGSITLDLPVPERRWNDVRPAATLGVRLDRSGQLSWWGSLPGDSIGSVLDEHELVRQVADGLQLLASLAVLDLDRHVAVALGVADTMLLTQGSVHDFPRTGATMLRMSGGPLRVEPDESVPAAALGAGAGEVARPLARRLVGLITR
jgi:hypothetical protein